MRTGIVAALVAAALFGVSTPIAKMLVGAISPWMLAGLLYLGSGLGLAAWRLATRAPRVALAPGDVPWLAGAVAAGGIVAPVLLMYGVARMPASEASMLLNAEGLFTALLAWFVFKENFDRRIAAGMVAIVAGAVLLSWPGRGDFASIWPTLAILGACLGWGLDNNLTRKVALANASFIAMVKGLVAGITNVALAFVVGASFPQIGTAAGALFLGFVSYGLSLTLFVIALRQLGSARTGAYFSTAPFIGAASALLFLPEPLTWQFMGAALLMTVGVWLHVTEHHEHSHAHEAIEHIHEHAHDEHHPSWSRPPHRFRRPPHPPAPARTADAYPCAFPGYPSPAPALTRRAKLPVPMSDCCEDKACAIEALRERQSATLKIVLVINAIMFGVELVAGLLANSTALMSDALDNLGDALTYGLSLYAVARGQETKAKVALLKGALILAAGLFVAAQVVYRAVVPAAPIFEAMGVVSLVALAANAICLGLLWKHRSEDVNMSSVWQCSRNDIASNVAVFCAAGAVWLLDSHWPDLVVGALLAALFLRSAMRVLTDARSALDAAQAIQPS